ncbi:MAG: 16S rRNA (cytidine(1402)-2'-O)-methyltransferase [bacterium]
MNTGKLYIIATPIGNLGDIGLRALETLKQADLILCEDTRVTRNLLDRYQIKTPTLSYHQHSDSKKIKKIQSLLNENKNLALVTDAGTPGISDPGNQLVATIVGEQNDLGILVIPIPGPSAVITALSVSGFPTDKFLFLGFPPHKNKRQKFFKELADSKYTVAFYESSHRIKKCLQDLNKFLEPDQQIVICRELTKKFENIYRGTIGQLIGLDNIPAKGEFVIIIN